MFRFSLGHDIELRLLEDRHAGRLFALTDANRAHLRPWLPWIDHTQSLRDTAAFIRGGLQQFADNNGLQAGIWFRDELAGVVGYHYISWMNRRTELGYWLGAAFQGHGIMTRACRGLVEYAFDELELNRVEIRCAAENTRSRAVAQRLHFIEEGVLRQVEWLHDRVADQVVYGAVAGDWPRDKRDPAS